MNTTPLGSKVVAVWTVLVSIRGRTSGLSKVFATLSCQDSYHRTYYMALAHGVVVDEKA